ncbi:SCO family protein [Piscinibacter sp.]|uniref:SCO family protein n=1 Tax=Piscinibacter sp. TaxID=1903157 RepID=UPI002ED5A01D
MNRRRALGFLLACAALVGAHSAAATNESIYALGTPLTDQSGRAFTLGDKQGTPMIVSMFYTSCQFVCPMLVDAIRATEQKLSDPERQRLNVLLVSFDPAHDIVEVLGKTAAGRQLDTRRWSLARTDARNVRKLAAMLDIQYRALDNGDFNHSTVLVLVDANGRIVGRTTELSGADPAFVKLVKTTLGDAARH